MKYIILGIKDWCKDTWHDWLRNRVMAYGGRVYDKAYYDDGSYIWYSSDAWKEGNVWHYIRQRKFAKKK